MFHGSKYGYRYANQIGLEKWVQVYQGEMGIALTDTYTTDVFLNSFGPLYSRLFDGVRQDSGDPIEFTNKILTHYHHRIGIPSSNKTIVYSDALNYKKLSEIKKFLIGTKASIIDRYGIGTWLTNDLLGITPLNMVIKLHSVVIDGLTGRWQPAVKLSDDVGKNTGDFMETMCCKQTLGIKL